LEEAYFRSDTLVRMIETMRFQLLLATFAGWVGRHQARTIAYLIEENRVLKEQLESGGRRLRFTDDQRRRLAAKGKPLGRRMLQQIATIVAPDTTWRGIVGSLLRSGPIPESGLVVQGS
jgi:hypothetical protein